MNRWMLTAALVFSTILGVDFNDPAGVHNRVKRIIKGRDAVVGAFPWMVAVMIKNGKNP